MLAIRLPQDIEKRLEKLARCTGRTKTFYVREAILEHLDDLEDLYLAERTLDRIRRGDEQTIPLEDAPALGIAGKSIGSLPAPKPSNLRPAIRSATMNPMTTRDFKVFLEPDEDYGGYVVVCPSLPGCYSQGKSVSEALANIREAIDLCLEDMESRGEEIPDPNNVLIGSVVVTR